jgi:cell division protein FtsB
LESSRCEECNNDITRVYNGINFKERGGKLHFFSQLNENPDMEMHVLYEHCVYAIDKTSASLTGRINPVESASVSSIPKPKHSSADSVNQEPDKDIRPSNNNKNEPNKNPGSKITINTGNHHKPVLSGFKRVIACVLIFIFGVCANKLFVVLGKSDEQNIASQKALQRENDSLQIYNETLEDSITTLHAKISELENLNSIQSQFPAGFDLYMINDAEVFFGNTVNGLPEGIGTVYSSENILVGTFTQGKKNGKFYIFHQDGSSEIVIFLNDLAIRPHPPLK